MLSNNITKGNTLPSPEVKSDTICGAGYAVLYAESEIEDPDLVFVWYNGAEEELGRESGPNGVSEFITPFVIKNETFYVSIEFRGISSSLSLAKVIVDNTASVLEGPRAQICGSVILHAQVEINDAESTSFQWQKLSAEDADEVIYQDIPDENGLNLSLDQIGFYRISAKLDGCLVFSEQVEVTENLVAEAIPMGDSVHCYMADNNVNDSLTYYSDWYRHGVTSIAWYSSTDNGASYTELLDTTRSVDIGKPSWIIDTEETVYYRLIVSEQNCSDQKDFKIKWAPKPRGTIEHLNGSTDDFSYCETDDESTRTLVINTDDNVEVVWYRLLHTFIPIEWMKLITIEQIQEMRESEYNPYEEIFVDLPKIDLFENIGRGDQISLNQSMGGLIFAILENNDTGCKDYSSNVIFADTPFPFVSTLFDPLFPISPLPFNGVCSGLNTLTVYSWDKDADNHTWYYSTGSTYTEVGSTNSYFVDGINQTGNITGTYKLGVEKNACYHESSPFNLFEYYAPESVIETTNTAYCLGKDVVLESKEIFDKFEYYWYERSDVDKKLVGLGTKFVPTVAGIYSLTVYTPFCSSTSEPVEITDIAVPSIIFSEPADPSMGFCSATQATLAHQNQGDTYQWYASDNNVDYIPLADEVSGDYLITDRGFYFVHVVNSAGCYAVSDTIQVLETLNTELNFEKEVIMCGDNEQALLWLKSPEEGSLYQWKYSIDGIVAYTNASGQSQSTYYQADETGFYQLEIIGERCVAMSHPIEVKSDGELKSLDDTILGEHEACSGTTISLTSKYSSLTADYIWLYSVDGNIYTPFTSESDAQLLFYADQFTDDSNPEKTITILLGIQDESCTALSDPFEITSYLRPDLEIRNSIDNSYEDIFICDLADTNIELEAFQLNTNRPLIYKWSIFNSSTKEFDHLESADQKALTLNESGTYRCSGTIPNTSCVSLSNIMNATSPPRKIEGDSTFCYGEIIKINVAQEYLSDESFESFTYEWYFSENNLPFELIDSITSPTIEATTGRNGFSGGQFYYTAQYKNCKVFSNIWKVKEDDHSFRLSILGELVQEKGIPFELNATTNQIDISSVNWEPSDFILSSNTNQAVITVPEDYGRETIFISAHMTAKSGCSSTESVQVSLSDSETLTFSTIISPNNDGLNDVFRVKGLDSTLPNQLFIFDSWGNKAYETKNYKNDLMSSDHMTQSIITGTYYYLFDSEGKVFKGSFYVKK